MNWKNILDMYTLQEVLERAGLEEHEVLEFLELHGYLDDLEIEEPV